jgi:hypothetical protein
MKEKICYRGKLIKTIFDSCFDPIDFIDEFKEKLQNKLNLNLKFKTDISNIETKDNFNYFKIYFEDENCMKALNFIITKKRY